jgi:MFS family permease
VIDKLISLIENTRQTSGENIMLPLLRHRNFTLIWAGGLISMIGNWILMTALPFHVYAMTGSALATSAILMAYIAPGVLFSSVAGVFADRWDRRRTMFVMALGQGAATLALLLVQSPEWIWVVYTVVFVQSSLGHFFGPAENALLPTLVGEEQLMAANSMNSMNDNLARLIGPAVGGLLLAWHSFASIVVVDALTYFVAAGLIGLVQVRARPAADEPAPIGWFQVWREWVAGLQLVRDTAILRNTFIVIAFALFGDAILSAILVVFVQDVMQIGAEGFGWIMAARGLGGLMGGLLLANVGKDLAPTRLITISMIATGVLTLVMVNLPLMLVVLPLVLILGLPAIGSMIAAQTILQQQTPDAFRGRVFGAFGTTIMLLMFVGNALAGLSTDVVGVTVVMNSAGLIYFLAGGVAVVLFAGSVGVSRQATR